MFQTMQSVTVHFAPSVPDPPPVSWLLSQATWVHQASETSPENTKTETMSAVVRQSVVENHWFRSRMKFGVGWLS